MGDTLMAYGTLLTDAVQSSTANTPPQFNDGNGTQVGTLCRAWVNFNGVTTATIRASFNVSSVTRTVAGDYTVNFTNAMPDANYSASCLSGKNVTADSLSLNNPNTENFATGSLRVVCKYQPSGSSYDVPMVSVAIFR